ncbi:hypothetical protein CTAYLR_007172 [Chrysophaeum taylorii]|uniref:Ribosomal protein/NADH dehydrogenase domain-containing protein n=1 Tax=Chrysophaeum taylorii TaxID=2483200 RepID=A0AAD7ULV9_9STRA|nr:hypothetical protein CTAYLR_007172 [Chrysophaeum taylorii]
MAWRATISRQLHEIKILISNGSDGINAPVKSFLVKNYHHLKTLNPKFPFLIRSYNGDPVLVARYGFGVEETKSLTGLDEAQIEEAFKDLVKLGDKYPRAWPISEDLPPVVVNAISTDVGFD